MERFLPQNIEAEASVLGSLLIDPEAISLVIDFLRADDFYRDGHRVIYETILELYERHEPADFVILCHELGRYNKLEEAGGESYIASLVSLVPTSGNIEYYGRIVQRMATLRRLIHVGGQIVATAYAEDDAEAVLEQSEQMIFSVRQERSQNRSQTAHIRDAITSYMDRLDSLYTRRSGLIGTPTGFSDLDRLLGGLQRSDLIILAARPAVGKTSFALSLAYNAAVRYQCKIGIFSLEMSIDQLVQRLISMEAGVDQQRLRSGRVEDDEWDHVVRAANIFSAVTILLDETASLTTSQLRSKARQWISEADGLDLIIVDYLQLMQSEAGGGRSDNRVQVIDEISRQLKVLARELNVPILALAQLSRAVETRQSKVPQLSDLRESGSLEQNADIVMFIYRDEVYNPETERKGLADIIVAKHRNGPTGEVCLYFNRSQTRFQDMVQEQSVPNPFLDDDDDDDNRYLG
jgi:replicative DNA helicase